MKIGAIIVAGGKGLRAGGSLPKQVQLLGKKRVFEWSLDVFCEHPEIDEIVLVVPEGCTDSYATRLSDRYKIVTGGETRSRSVQAGLKQLSLDPENIVLIHDAARPGITPDIITELIAKLSESDASAPALKVTDALKRCDGNRLINLERSQLVRVQTPQAFRFGQICEALAATEIEPVDDLQAIEALNGRIELIEGDERLHKITRPEDFWKMSRLLLTPDAIRVGIGYDVHAFGPGDSVTLCGLSIPHSKALIGHSDADVAWHALSDAILGAAALGDIGDHFPPSDPQWKGAPSSKFLKHAQVIALEAGYSIQSCDITLVCEAPKIKPHREVMRQSTADLLDLPLSAVSLKATTTEGLGFTGRGEGIAAQATAVLSG